MTDTDCPAPIGTLPMYWDLWALAPSWQWLSGCRAAKSEASMTPGEIITDGPDHTLNPGRRTLTAYNR